MPEQGDIVKTPVTVRIEAGLLAETRRCAHAENRTLTNFIETVLRRKVTGAVPATSPGAARRTCTTGRAKDKPPHVT